MAGAKRLVQLAKKWQRVDALGRKKLTVTAEEDEGRCTTVPAKGHCIMYTADGRRFEVPLVYLSTTVFGELLRMSQEEFGFASDGKITLPCDAAVMEYVMCLLRRNASAEVESALLTEASHDALQEGMAPLESGTASGSDKPTGISPDPRPQKTPGAPKHHHQASPPTSTRHHGLVVTTAVS